MRKPLLLLAAISLLGFSSCEKNVSESPGTIPGMGNAAGKLQIETPFTLPEGINIVGDITGMDNPGAKSDELKPAFDSKTGYSLYGSGKYIKLKLTLVNTKNYARTVFFHKGLIWECIVGEFQHCLQMQTSWVCLQPNSTRTIVIDLYCINKGIPAPNTTGGYKILGVTSSKTIWNLLNMVGWRMINYEMCNNSKSGPSYAEITERLQTIVWNLTNDGIDISEENKAFINGIPELSPEDIPAVDANSQFPEYFEEFVVGGK